MAGTPENWVLLNTDGAARGNPGMAGDWDEFYVDLEVNGWVAALNIRTGICSLVKAELRAVLRRLKFARDRGIGRLKIQMDSLVVVGFLKVEFQPTLEHHSLVKQCRELVKSQGWKVSI